MVRAGRPGISRATRSEFRNLMTSVVVGAIDDAFSDEDFQPLESVTYVDSSVRRSRTEEYLQGVDWHDAGHVRRALRVFERLISRYLQEVAGDTTYLARLRRELANDGYQLTDEARILRMGPQLPAGALATLKDSAAIEEQLERLAGAADDDPALAVGSAKELVESTAKVILTERGRSFADRADLPELVRAAQEALMLHPNQQAEGPDGTQGVKKILGGLITITSGLAELRNRGYGIGHGAAGARVGLHPRHAHLAVNASITWCRLMLDTLHDPQAPWATATQTPE
jgi:hypothetical protein